MIGNDEDGSIAAGGPIGDLVMRCFPPGDIEDLEHKERGVKGPCRRRPEHWDRGAGRGPREGGGGELKKVAGEGKRWEEEGGGIGGTQGKLRRGGRTLGHELPSHFLNSCGKGGTDLSAARPPPPSAADLLPRDPVDVWGRARDRRGLLSFSEAMQRASGEAHRPS